MRRKGLVALIMLILMLPSCGIKKEIIKNIKNNEEVEEGLKSDDVIIALQTSGNRYRTFSNIGGEKMVEIDEELDPCTVHYSEELKKILGRRTTGELIAIDKNGRVDVLASYTEKTKLSVASVAYYIVNQTYKVSNDKKKIVYVDSTNNLNLIDGKGKKEIIKKLNYKEIFNELNILFSEDGEKIFIRDDDGLSLYENGELNIITTQKVEEYSTSPDGNYIFYSIGERIGGFGTYKIKNLKTGEEKELESKERFEVNLHNDGSYMEQSDYTEVTWSYRGCFVDKNGERHDLPNRVADLRLGFSEKENYIIKDNKLYYKETKIDSDYIPVGVDALLEYDLETKQYKKITDADDIDFGDDKIFISKFDYEKNIEVYGFLDKDGKLKKDTKEISESDLYINNELRVNSKLESLNDKHAIFLSRDGTLFVNEEEVAKNVINYETYRNKIVYRNTSGEVYSLDGKSLDKKKIEIGNANGYEVIYYGDRPLKMNTDVLSETN